jgi:hypothetical protein
MIVYSELLFTLTGIEIFMKYVLDDILLFPFIKKLLVYD